MSGRAEGPPTRPQAAGPSEPRHSTDGTRKRPLGPGEDGGAAGKRARGSTSPEPSGRSSAALLELPRDVLEKVVAGFEPGELRRLYNASLSLQAALRGTFATTMQGLALTGPQPLARLTATKQLVVMPPADGLAPLAQVAMRGRNTAAEAAAFGLVAATGAVAEDQPTRADVASAADARLREVAVGALDPGARFIAVRYLATSGQCPLDRLVPALAAIATSSLARRAVVVSHADLQDLLDGRGPRRDRAGSHADLRDLFDSRGPRRDRAGSPPAAGEPIWQLAPQYERLGRRAGTRSSSYNGSTVIFRSADSYAAAALQALGTLAAGRASFGWDEGRAPSEPALAALLDLAARPELGAIRVQAAALLRDRGREQEAVAAFTAVAMTPRDGPDVAPDSLRAAVSALFSMAGHSPHARRAVAEVLVGAPRAAVRSHTANQAGWTPGLGLVAELAQVALGPVEPGFAWWHAEGVDTVAQRQATKALLNAARGIGVRAAAAGAALASVARLASEPAARLPAVAHVRSAAAVLHDPAALLAQALAPAPPVGNLPADCASRLLVDPTHGKRARAIILARGASVAALALGIEAVHRGRLIEPGDVPGLLRCARGGPQGDIELNARAVETLLTVDWSPAAPLMVTANELGRIAHRAQAPALRAAFLRGLARLGPGPEPDSPLMNQITSAAALAAVTCAITFPYATLDQRMHALRHLVRLVRERGNLFHADLAMLGRRVLERIANHPRVGQRMRQIASEALA